MQRHVAARHDMSGRHHAIRFVLESATASRYFWFQFFASLKKWIGARNPVQTGSSCAAVTGYDFPRPIVPQTRDGEGGEKGRSASAEPQARSQNIRPLHLIRQRDAGPGFD